MNEQRLQKLQEYLKENPEDPFLIYALANEYLNHDPLKAKEYFEHLMAHHPDYVGTYYQAGKLYEALDNEEKAEEVYKTGIEKAREQEETKIMGELQQALEMINDEDF